MKKIIYTTVFFLLVNYCLGQVNIDKNNTNQISTILEFDDSAVNTKGIILSAVNNLTQALSSNISANNGTFLFDKSDKKIKMYENGSWVALSEEGDIGNLVINSSPEAGEGVIIGAQTTNAKGVLVLESANRALILPKIANPHTTVKSPYPGMLCYDTVGKTMAVFDGKVWNYWK